MAKIRTRARAVDMLGRQQIAGIQNAVSELFKNAHDAYAKNVRIDYFEKNGKNGEGLLVIRDNGVGMTHDDFLNKWLVLGTESKFSHSSRSGYIPVGYDQRPITGEKGIGRLAIALLGRQVLVVTRAVREDGPNDLVMAWIHWGLFEIPGVDIEDIEVPVSTHHGPTLPSIEDIVHLKGKLLACVKELEIRKPHAAYEKIIREIQGFSPKLQELDEFFQSRESERLELVG